MIFLDRKEAGERLAHELGKLTLVAPIVLALPRGGVPVGNAAARVLGCPLDVIPLMKIPIPWSAEASYGVVAMDGTIALNRPLVNRLELSDRELEIVTRIVHQEAGRREQLYRRGKPYPGLANRTVIIIDDGIASGYSMLAAVNFVKKRGYQSLIVATPVASDIAVRMLAADDSSYKIITLVRDQETVFSLADYYRAFPVLTDKDVIRELA